MAISTAPRTAAEQKAWYDEQGYITFPDMLSPAEVDVLQAALTELLEEADTVPDDVEMTEVFSFTRSETGERRVRRIFNPIATTRPFATWSSTRGSSTRSRT